MTQATPDEIMRRLELESDQAEAALEAAWDEAASAFAYYRGLCDRAANSPDPFAADAEAAAAYADYQELRQRIGASEIDAEAAADRLEYARDEEGAERAAYEFQHLEIPL